MIENVFIAGAGFMGHGIAQVHAVIGKRVVLYEPELARAEAGRDRIAANLERAVEKGRLTIDERQAILDRIEPVARLDRVADADLVIEAVYEDLDIKRQVWAALDALAGPDAIFATNTSSILIARLAQAVSPDRRTRFVGMHFFSPVPVMPLVEVIPAPTTDRAVVATVRDHGVALGKQVITSADRPGFIVNRILLPFLAEAMRAHEQGVATADDIDLGARVGLNHPMGPLALADLIGLDVCLGVLHVLHAELGDAQFRPPKVLEDLVAAGHLGQKTGRGFHEYPRA